MQYIRILEVERQIRRWQVVTEVTNDGERHCKMRDDLIKYWNWAKFSLEKMIGEANDKYENVGDTCVIKKKTKYDLILNFITTNTIITKNTR